MKDEAKVGYLTSTIPMSSPIVNHSATWGAESSIVMAWLINSMESRICLFYKTAKDIWDV